MRLAKRRQSEKGAKRVSCHALRRYTLHVMRTLVKNIKGLVGAFDEVPRDVAGSEMAKFPILHNAWLAVEDGMVVDFGGMDEFPGIVDWSGLNIVDAEGRWVLPAWCDSHTHTVFARSRSEEFLMRLEGATYQEIAERGGGILNSAKALQAMSEDELFEDALKRVHHAIAQGVGAMEIKSGYGLTMDAERKMLRVIARLKEAAPIPIKATFLGCHAVPPEFENAAAYTQHVVADMLPAFAAEGLVDYVDAFCEKGYFGTEETRALLEASNALGLKSKVHVNQFNDIGGVELCVKQNALSVDHLEVCGSEAIQSLIEGFERAEDGEGAPTSRGLARVQPFLEHPVHARPRHHRRRIAACVGHRPQPRIGAERRHDNGRAARQPEDGGVATRGSGCCHLERRSGHGTQPRGWGLGTEATARISS